MPTIAKKNVPSRAIQSPSRSTYRFGMTKAAIVNEQSLTKEEVEQKKYGRRLNDTKGARRPLCCSFNYGFYDASREPGTNFLESIAITSSLATTDDTEAENDNCKAFIKRYFGKYHVFDDTQTSDELTKAREGLLDQLYYDITYRRYRKTSGDNQIHWVNTFLATSVSIISFARTIIPNNNQNSYPNTHAIVNYFEGAAALSALIFSKIKNASTQDPLDP